MAISSSSLSAALFPVCNSSSISAQPKFSVLFAFQIPLSYRFSTNLDCQQLRFLLLLKSWMPRMSLLLLDIPAASTLSVGGDSDKAAPKQKIRIKLRSYWVPLIEDIVSKLWTLQERQMQRPLLQTIDKLMLLDLPAACLHSSKTKTPDPNKPQIDDHVYNYAKYCRPNFPDHVSQTPISEKELHITKNGGILEDIEEGVVLIVGKKADGARLDVEQEPILLNYYKNSILAQDSTGSALAYHLSMKLCNSSLPSDTLVIFHGGAYGG
ncbi:Diamine acetyltransferase 1 [Datura stramonium]|uniref:Diamine acetyltransferase 1 n=1 Tax=Datura stramonium TaxID=4076 RepID=A0ABS8WGU7_DATST|nr:Diamine acetyltransferase 1 [Datura stramonium]